MRKIPGLVDPDASLKDDKPIVAIDVRRELASDLGVGVAEVGQALRARCCQATPSAHGVRPTIRITT
ncbi:MAG: hypothetical protein CBARDMAM_3488 [uncultured Caballeronia sp.]|nr:MAG: hypothetical protein CBARDMAM_3488 [uncultured Caballeronia sp.]